MDAASLLLQAHGRLLRTISDHHAAHFVGLSVAARRGLRSKRLCKKLVLLDGALSVVRHITMASIQQLCDEVSADLGLAGKGVPPASPLAAGTPGGDAQPKQGEQAAAHAKSISAGPEEIGQPAAEQAAKKQAGVERQAQTRPESIHLAVGQGAKGQAEAARSRRAVLRVVFSASSVLKR